MNKEIIGFVKHARGKGLDLPSIRRMLLSVGWKENEIAEAFCAHELDIPIPTPPGTSSARDMFIYLLAFVALYTWIISLIVLLFSYINLGFPDVAMDTQWRSAEHDYKSIRSSMAATIVAVPLFLILWLSLLRETRAHPERARSAVRRWLLYLSLFVGAIVLTSDVITLIYFLFEGELSLRFILKAASLFVVVGVAFAYIVVTLKSDAQQTS